MAINFPSNRDEAGLGTGPLEEGDEWSYNNIDYTYTFSPDSTGLWSAKIASAPASVTAGDGINIGAGNSISVDNTVARLSPPNALTNSRVSDYVTDPFGNHVNIFRADQANTDHNRKKLATEEWVLANAGGGEVDLTDYIKYGTNTRDDNVVLRDDTSNSNAFQFILNGNNAGSMEMISANNSKIDFRHSTPGADPDYTSRIASQDNGEFVITSRRVNVKGELSINGAKVTPNTLPKGTYSILDPIFGGPVLVPDAKYASRCTPTPDADGFYYWTKFEDGTSLDPADQNKYKYEDWSRAFNRALSGFDTSFPPQDNGDDWSQTRHDKNNNNENNVLPNGMIETLIIPDGSYDCYFAVKRTRVVKIIGSAGKPKIVFFKQVGYDIFDVGSDEVVDSKKDYIFTADPIEITSGGVTNKGQLVLANKAILQNVYITGKQEALGGQDPTKNGNFSTVLAQRFYDNDGIPFNLTATNVEKKQNDSADMDTGFIDCGFGGKGDGISGEDYSSTKENPEDPDGDPINIFARNGCLKYVGRNAYIIRCSFNHNRSGIVLTFPDEPGTTHTNSGGTSSAACGSNNSAWNKSQGGWYGWRRCQIIDCYFHMNRAAQCISVYGRYQCSGLLISNNLTDIGGQLLEVNGLPASDGIFTNGVGGGLKNATITANSFANYDKSGNEEGGGEGGALIHFISGRYDNNSIVGNSLYGSDFSGFADGVCLNLGSSGLPAYKAGQQAKRPRYHILIENAGDNGTKIFGLAINGNNFGYSSDSSINVKDNPDVFGLSVTGNTFSGIGAGVARTDAADHDGSPNPNSKCLSVPGSGTKLMYGTFISNTLVQTFSGGCSEFTNTNATEIKFSEDLNSKVLLTVDNDALSNASQNSIPRPTITTTTTPEPTPTPEPSSGY